MIVADVTLRIRLDAAEMTPEVVAALENLAAVMLVQGEAGLYSLGAPEAESIDGTPSLLVADVVGLELVGIARGII